MASFYARNGSLSLNGAEPAIGMEELAKIPSSYMEAFPGLRLLMDSLVTDSGTYRYHRTFTGRNTEPGGSGKKVVFNGLEQ